MNNQNLKAKKISLSGIMLALSMITLFAATTLPTSRLSLYALSSFFVSIIIIEFGIKAGWLFFIAACILSFLVLPNKLGLPPYIVFFGIYGIIKFYLEKLRLVILEYVLKFVYFNICLFLAFCFIRNFLLINIEIKLPVWIIVIASEIIFILYDYVYTLFIQYYNEKLKRILKI